jgi:excisionase family DNA binding protein
MTARLLTARQVAEQLGVAPDTVLRWTRRGELPAVKLPGGAVRYREDGLDDWLEQRTTGADRFPTTQDGRAALRTPPARPGPQEVPMTEKDRT